MCDCITKVNELLANEKLALKTKPTINLKTGVMSMELALETYVKEKGGKKKFIRPAFCPFCGGDKTAKIPQRENDDELDPADDHHTIHETQT